MKRTRRKLSPAEMELALAFKVAFLGEPCAIHADPEDCELPIQAAHVISKQALRRRGFPAEVVYDPRNGLPACYRAHRRSDAGLERFPIDCLPESAFEFAAEHGLTFLIERYYGTRAAA